VYNNANALAPGIYFFCEEAGKSEIVNIIGEVVATGTTDYEGERKCGKFIVCNPATIAGGNGSNGQQSNPALLQILLNQSPVSGQSNGVISCTNCPFLGTVYENDVQHI